jgi:teneurin
MNSYGQKYHCSCNIGWTGVSCDTQIEMICNDGIDNDNDGLTDCYDSECCVYDSCKLSLACNMAPEPKDRLLRKQPPSVTASFFDKMRFLIEDGSVQSFADSLSFTKR